MSVKAHPPVHPGEILQLEFLEPLGISHYRLAKDISVPPRRINEIVKGQRSITANTALRLARYFGTSDRFWLNLQAHHDLEQERDRLGTSLEKEVHVLATTK
ncbi:MAG: HigA family addiction module antitoxin [Planctomycetaceae bacterium]